jgi:hypothetical protein
VKVEQLKELVQAQPFEAFCRVMANGTLGITPRGFHLEHAQSACGTGSLAQRRIAVGEFAVGGGIGETAGERKARRQAAQTP